MADSADKAKEAAPASEKPRAEPAGENVEDLVKTLWHQLKDDKTWFAANPPTGLTLEQLAAKDVPKSDS